MQPSRGGHRQLRHFTHDGAKLTMPEPFLHAGKRRSIIAL